MLQRSSLGIGQSRAGFFTNFPRPLLAHARKMLTIFSQTKIRKLLLLLLQIKLKNKTKQTWQIFSKAVLFVPQMSLFPSTGWMIME